MTRLESEPELPPAWDLLAVDQLLTADDLLLRDTIRAFVRSRVLPSISAHFDAGTFPQDLIPELAALGLFGMQLDGYGCAGASAVSYGLAAEELEAGDSGLRSFVTVQGSLAMYAIWRFGSEDQKAVWLPDMAAGRVIGCFALTEPDGGSDPGAMRTSARRDGSDWILNGEKVWITNGSIADLAVVWARTADGVRGFLVERETPGFISVDIVRKMSLRASVTSALSFSEVRVPGHMVLPSAMSLRAPLSCLDEARFGIAWGALGAARACLEAALDYSRDRVVFGRPIARFQLTQRKLADIATDLAHGRLSAHRLAVMKDEGRLHPAQVSLAKRANVRIALEVARSARTILGANGLTLDYPVMRHMANLETVLTYEGTEEIHTLVLGRALTGEDAFS